MSGAWAEAQAFPVCSGRGVKGNPWLTLNAVVTMFDSGGSSGQLGDELGVLPPGDVLKCSLALARNEGEARCVGDCRAEITGASWRGSFRPWSSSWSAPH